MLRVLSILALALLPTFAATADAPRDELLAVPLGEGGTEPTYYVSVCTLNADDGRVPHPTECFLTGVYQETNGRGGLQTRAGVADGLAYTRDTPVLG